MKYLMIFCLFFLLSCNAGNSNMPASTQIDSPHPSKVEPPVDAIPGDMRIKKDSVVVPTDSILKVESGNH